MRSKIIGLINEIETELSFLRLGYSISIPQGDTDRYDYLVDIDNHFIRIQSKSPMIIENGDAIRLWLFSSTTIKGKRHHKCYTPDEVDYVATHYNGQSYLIPVTGARNIILRLRGPSANTTHWAEDYELEKVVEQIKRNKAR